MNDRIRFASNVVHSESVLQIPCVGVVGIGAWIG